MKVKILKDFRWAHTPGVITDYTKGEVVNMEPNDAKRAIKNGWVQSMENKNKGTAPENKAKSTSVSKSNVNKIRVNKRTSK
jgi:hypothetical protein